MSEELRSCKLLSVVKKEKKRKFPSHTALLDNHSVLDFSIFVKVKVTQSCPAFCDPMDYTVHGILQARILEWLAIPFSRGSFQPRDRTQVSNPGLPHCRRTLYQLGQQGSPGILLWVAYPFSSRFPQPRNQTGVSYIAGRFFTS